MQISMFLHSLDIFSIFNFFSIVKCLGDFNCSIFSVLFNSVNFYSLAIFFVHFCDVEFSLTIDQLKVARFWVQLGSFQDRIKRFFLLFCHSFSLFWFLLDFRTIGLVSNLFFCFHIRLILFWFFLSLSFIEILHLSMEIFEQTFIWGFFCILICLLLLEEHVVGFGNIFELLLTLRSWIIFGVVFQGISSIRFFDFLDIGILVNAKSFVWIKLLSNPLWEVFFKESSFFGLQICCTL